MLDTLANVKSGLKITSSGDDTLLSRLMDAADSFVAQHTGRAFAGGSFTETHPAGGSLLFLRNFPVASVTSLRVDPNRAFGTETVRPADSYVVHADRGVVESLTGPFLPPRPGRGSRDWPGAVQVAYATATGQVPPAVMQAFTDLVGHWYREAKTHADLSYEMLTGQTSGTDTKTYPWGVSGGFHLPIGVLQLLKPFRVPPA
jgi:uncharacterized phiE125 gp8 family phage protein